MSRRLTPRTIIPPELYVLRAADKQLRDVLRDMGRPAYILVARQMGKTNLLLNAKRELEGKDAALIYVDLSAPFASERECFRNIIDIALETRRDIFGKCTAAILEARKASPPPPYREHENELRALLDELPGKLVIILDEIDSLTKTAFSDRIFAQIRSVYFTRTNYPQFNNLTYVLSGVVEPNEIIKDKRISPFNIGEKIYLDDFSENQFLDFLSRAGLELSNETKERVYHWANGNPRLTWDICFDLEEKLATGHFLTPDVVDESVRKLYLTDFTRAPVDHIREVVASDDELRNAVTVIKYGKGHTLPDAVKNKLYLSGIIGAVANHRDISIKNRIIAAALSDQWLRAISLKKKGLARLAAERFEERNYTEAIALYEQFLRSPDISEEKKNSANWQMALCAYNLGDYAKALTYLEKTKWDEEVAAVLYFERKFYLGATYLQIGNIPASRAEFQETLRTPKKDTTYVSALINLGATYTAEHNFSRAIELYQDALTSVESATLSEEDHAKMKASALYNLAKTYANMGQVTSARTQFTQALEAALPQQRPTVVLGLCQVLNGRQEKEKLLSDSADLIISNNLLPDPYQPEGTLAFTTSVFYSLLRESYSVSRPVFERLFTFADRIAALDTSDSALMLRLAYLSAGKREFGAAVSMARDAVEASRTGPVINKDAEFQSYRLLCILCKGADRQRYRNKYADCLKNGYKPKAIDPVDLEILVDLADDSLKLKRPTAALDYLDFAKKQSATLSESDAPDFAVVLFYEMMALRSAKHWERLKQAAHETLRFIESLGNRTQGSRLVDAQGLKAIENQARANLQRAPGPPLDLPVGTSERKIARNEKVSVRYNDGSVKLNVKYKKIASDLAANLCVLLAD